MDGVTEATRVPDNEVRRARRTTDGVTSGAPTTSPDDLRRLVKAICELCGERDQLLRRTPRMASTSAEMARYSRDRTTLVSEALEARRLAEAEVERLREALERIAGMGGALTSAGDVARAAIASSPDEGGERNG